MKQFFSMDNKFFSIMTRIADLLILNFLFLICSIPIITIGASVTALYSVTLKMTTNDETYMFRSFMKAFKDNFKASTIVWLIFITIGLVLSVDFYFANLFSASPIGSILRVVFTGLVILTFLMISYVFPLVAQFYNTTFNYIKNSFLMAICHLPQTLVIFIINAIPIVCFLVGSYLLAFGTVFYFFLGFSLSAFINSFLFNKVFANYK
ncbi:MAG: DUF624 domain-containing protein [Clostridium sp.]